MHQISIDIVFSLDSLDFYEQKIKSFSICMSFFMPQNVISYKYLFSCLSETVSSYSPEACMRLWTLYTDLYKRRNSIRIILTILFQQRDLKSRHLTASALILQCKTNKKNSKPDTFIHIRFLQIPPLRFQIHSGLIHSWFRFMSWI